LIHGQHLRVADLDLVRATRTPIAVCPGTIAWFRRDPPPLRSWLARGICVALGSDSLASSPRRRPSMLDELVLARRLWPDVPPSTLLWLATAAGGRALARPGLGLLRRGGRADLLAVDCAVPSVDALANQLTAGAPRLSAVWLAGELVRGPESDRIADLAEPPG
jgi:cytosine/adenosine deaminase-related metal-dependent hydrolase